MILYENSIDMRLTDYGIMIPVLDSRAKQILKHLERNEARIPCIDYNEAASRLGEDSKDLLIKKEDLQRIHDPAYIDGLFGQGSDNGAFLEKALLGTYELIDKDGSYHRYNPDGATRPLGELLHTILLQLSGSYMAGRLALHAAHAMQKTQTAEQQAAFCFFLGGGMHHARYDHGAGFCLLNDIMCAAARIQAEGRAALVWIIDVDAHKGDGTAELCSFSRQGQAVTELIQEGKAAVLSLSIHMGNSWPLDPETRAESVPGRAPLIDSDVEIPVFAGEESRYVQKLKEGIAELEKRSMHRKPDLVYVVDGADPYEYDGLDSTSELRLGLDQCMERDTLIYTYTKNRGIPSAWLLAGGYGERAWEPPAHFLSSISKK